MYKKVQRFRQERQDGLKKEKTPSADTQQKSNGYISLVKHNKEGKVIHTAVFKTDPNKAAELLKDEKTDISNSLGEIHVYSEEVLKEWLSDSNMVIDKKFGVRIFFSLIQNNHIKYDPDWYLDMLRLERAVCEIEPYRSMAYFHHYILKKI